MINILLPAMGSSLFFKDNFFPKLLIEVRGETMLERVVRNYDSIHNRTMIFVFGEKECQEFHLNDSVKILTQNKGNVIQLKNQTAGALCTCLMAVDYINKEDPLIIANSDQIIDIDYQKVLDYFQERKADAGVITFPSIHPRWSYVKQRGKYIIEVAEKRPLSQNAIAGFYYFNRGKDFVRAAQKVLIKDNSLNGVFYISSSLNELILENRRVEEYRIEKEKYHSFYSLEKIEEYREMYFG